MNTRFRFKWVNCNECGTAIRLSGRVPSKQYYCKKCANSIISLRCDRCNREYQGIPKNNRIHLCAECQSNNKSDLAGLSSRTLSKIWARANLPCSSCGWAECHCDIHHIIAVSEGGLDNLDNLVSLCPNCHRKAHNKILSVDYLQGISLKDFNIFDYYDKNKSIKQRRNKEYYSDENISEVDIHDLVTLSSSEISKKYRISNRFAILLRQHTLGFTHKRKFNVSKEELESLIKEKPMTEIGKQFGVSDSAVKKRCKKLGIELKDMRGYWSKLRAGKI